MNTVSVSPSWTYVAMCNKGNFDGFYFIKFKLPESIDEVPEFARVYKSCHTLENNSSDATWYFLNVLDSFACIEGCLTFEDYSNLENQKDRDVRRAAMVAEIANEYQIERHRCM